ncbi:uncharacterized protein LOC129913724 [Episyrphus balteatus]|uniref:uncharacterized protein LOC129913724 n=1 Tax=Episyrphus balteatus TaxID=286459 RepID=UPI00248594AB|nr:uncharacterized protein LOC129913724 [Episyrphus balteatus]
MSTQVRVVVVIVKYLVIHFLLFLLLLLISSVPGNVIAVDFARILNRILDYWQPNDIYVILNSTITQTGENVIGAMVYPRYVSARGDFSSFIHNHNHQHQLKNPIRWAVFPDNFVLVMFTDDSCQNVIPILRHQLSQEIIVKRSKIIVVAMHFISLDGNVDDGTTSCLEGMFRELWKKMGLLNVFVFDGTFIYGFNPFTKEFLIRHRGEDYKRLIAVDRAANFYGAELRVPQMDVYPGLQSIIWGKVSKKIGTFFFVEEPFAKFFNATLVTYTQKDHDFGFEFTINSTDSIVLPGIGKDLVQGLGDLTLIPRSYDSSNFFDFLSPVNFKECTLIIPKSERVPQYSIVVMVACSWVRLLSLVILALIVAFTGLVKKVLGLKLKMSCFIFELFSTYIGQSMRINIESLSMRLIIAFWLLTCILVGTLFNAEIVMGFLTPMYIRDYDNPFDAIQRSHFNIYTFDDFVYFLKGNSKKLFPSDEMFQLLLKKLKGVSRDEFFQRVLHPNKKDMFMVISMADNLLEKTKYLTEQTYSYHKTKPFFISLTANIVPRGSIIYNHYNDFNYRIFEAGLLQHWKNLELVYERKFGGSGGGDDVKATPAPQEDSLTIEDLYSAFLVLVLGYALALVAFAMERCFHCCCYC